jgi:enamine deaminase RidA (YjgF/YER057c/UK114 family)
MLTRAGTDRSRVLSVQVWLKTLDDLVGMNAVYDRWVVPDHRPCRSCAQVAMGDPDCRIEVIVVAAGPSLHE